MSVRANFVVIYLQGMPDRGMQSGTGMGNPANWLVNSWRTKQTGFCGFDQAITGAIYFTFQDGKKLSFHRPNHTSIQVFHFKISVKTKRTKQICFDKTKFFFRNFNLSNQSSGVQIPRDICTRLGWRLYSTKVQLDNKVQYYFWKLKSECENDNNKNIIL